MSILIKGMEMPKTEKHRGVMLTHCCFSVNTKGEKSLYIPNEDGSATKYPIIELPPHGRLIDESEVMQRLGITDMDCTKCAWGNHGFCGRGGDFNDACEAIEDAPTIIEAEVE